MKILLVGCGAVGLGIAAALYAAGECPDLIAQGETYSAIKNGGIARRGIFENVTVPKEQVRIFETVQEAGIGYDFVIVCCKTTVSEKVAEQLVAQPDLLAKDGRIVLFQNGFEIEQPFLRYFDVKLLCAGSIITGFSRPRRNESVVTVHSAPAYIGAIGGGDGGTYLLACAISAGGFPCEVTDDITKAQWAKMLYNCTLNPLSAILETSYGGLAQSSDAVLLMEKIIEEIYAVMNAAGYSTHWATAEAYKEEFFGKRLPSTVNHRASTLQDMERKIKTEIDTLTGVVVRLGHAHGVPVPFNEMLYRLVKAKESLYDFQQE